MFSLSYFGGGGPDPLAGAPYPLAGGPNPLAGGPYPLAEETPFCRTSE